VRHRVRRSRLLLGTNLSGELGTGSNSPETSSTPLPVAGGLSFTMLSAGSQHTCGLATDSTAYCWGSNYFGNLGDSTTTDRNAAAPVAGGLKFVTIASGNYHTCAITATGNAYCWARPWRADSATVRVRISRTPPTRFTPVA